MDTSLKFLSMARRSVFMGVAVSAILAACSSAALAAGGVPSREIPPSVLVEVQELDNRFELALAQDCAPDRCYSKGCTYVAHAVSDQPTSASLPGFSPDAGPGAGGSQAYLTQARCSFAHDKSIEPGDVQALVRRLQAKVSKGWTAVTVEHVALEPVPDSLRQSADAVVEATKPEPIVAPVVQAPEELTFAVAARQLWSQLLPYAQWWLGALVLTLAATALIWSWRRVGRASPEEQALLDQMARGDVDGDRPMATVQVEADGEHEVGTQRAAWSDRLGRLGATDQPDDIVTQELLRNLLHEHDLPTLAKAVLLFPDTLPQAFPKGGDVASAKMELADYLKTVDPASLPSEAVLFDTLNRQALAAALSTQSDAQIVRSLRDEFGAAGLSDLIARLSARAGALLLALAPAAQQLEIVQLLSPQRVAQLSEQVLLSNRMDPTEASYLFEVLSALRNDRPLPAAPKASVPSDRGPVFDAERALAVLLPALDAPTRGALFDGAIERRQGSAPAWYRGILFPDLLLELPDEARADLLLGVDVLALAAWLSLLDGPTQSRVLAGVSGSLRSALGASSTFPSRERQLALADRGRQALAVGLQAQLARLGLAFEHVLVSNSVTRS